MTKISQLALAFCVALSINSPYSNAFTFNPHPRAPAAFLSSSTSNPLVMSPSTFPISHDNNKNIFKTSLNMASVMQKLEDSAVEVTIVVPAKATKAAYDKAVLELSKNLTIPGFRKGSKIPPAVLENAMAARGGKNAIRVQAINDLANRLIEPALKEDHGLEPIGQPSLKVGAEELAESFVPGEDLEMVVKCDVWPEVSFKKTDDDSKPYFGLKGKYKRKPFDQAKFDVALKDLRERFAILTPLEDKDHKLEMGDACVVNMQGFMAEADGKTKGEALPDAASGDNVEVILGDGRYMEGLVEGLVGAKVGETVQVFVTFPERLKDKTLAGKKAVFDVNIESASNRSLPELDDVFANNVREGLTMESLTAELRKAVDEEDSKQFINERNEALATALAEVMDVQVPDTIITTQAREKYATMMAEFRDQGMADEEIKKLITPENFLKYKDIYKDGIVKDFKVTIGVEELAKLENIQVPDYQIQEQLENLKMEAQKAGDEFDEGTVRQRVEATLQSRQVFDFLAENSNLEVEYVDEDDKKVDEELLAELGEESLKREGFEGSFEDAAVEKEKV